MDFEPEMGVRPDTFGPPSDALLTGTLAGREWFSCRATDAGTAFCRSNSITGQHLGAEKTRSGVDHQRGAVGSLQARYRPCDIVLIDNSLTGRSSRPRNTFFVAASWVMSPSPNRFAKNCAVAAGQRPGGKGAHARSRHLCVHGWPGFSTRAESLTNHKLGYDVIGMTNLGEAKCAREAEIAYATAAMITDYDSWKTDEAHVTIEMVVDYLHRNPPRPGDCPQTIPKIPLEPTWSCHSALKNALLTDRKLWPAAAKKEARPAPGQISLIRR